ncbi:MAG TPA: hypothetical protein VEC35_01185 [Noviherbaspirillum sp.]|nr:hypothetical protein [Noviherbaspirillum sp.]
MGIPNTSRRHLLDSPFYRPNLLLNHVIEWMGVKNDSAMAEKLGVSHALISKARKRVLPIGDALLEKINKVTGKPMDELRRLSGVYPLQEQHNNGEEA